MLPSLGFILPFENKQARLGKALIWVIGRAWLLPNPTPLGRGRTRDAQTHLRETQELFSFSERPSKEVNMDHLAIYDT